MLPSGHEFIKNCVVLCLELNALLFLSLGLFLKIWWINGPGGNEVYHGLWQRVTCPDDLCYTTEGESSGYMVFTQIISVLALGLCVVAVVCCLAFFYNDKKMLSYMSGALLLMSGVVSLLVTVVLVGFFHKISDAWDRDLFRGNGISPEVLRYQTVPLYFTSISAFLCLIGFGFTIAKVNNPKLRQPKSTYKRLGSRIGPPPAIEEL